MATLVFADESALRAALESGLVPASVQAAPAEFGYDDDARPSFSPSADLSRTERRRLREAGVAIVRRKLRGGRTVSCWAEVLPATRSAVEPTPPLGEVLFLSEGDEAFLRVSGDLLRLGASDQRLAFFVDEHGVRRNLCRVAEPPYYSVLRALEPDDDLRAFAPARPGGRVWVELGFEHPAALQLSCEPGQLVLIPGHRRASGDREPWLRAPDGPWLELDAVSEVKLPPARTLAATAPSRKLEIELRLVRAPVRRPPDLWVLRDRPIAQVERLVRTIPESIVARLRFCVVEGPEPDQRMVVLRSRHSAEGPPMLDLDAEAYVPAPQVPELYIPVGMSVDPPLRPSRLRELCVADAGSRVVWLAPRPAPGRGQRFVREGLDEASFAPLSDWVDYLVGAHVDALRPWIRSTAFEFDRFVNIGVEWAEGERRPNKPKLDAMARPRPQSVQRASSDEPATTTFDDEAPVVDEAAPFDLTPVDLPRSEAEVRLAELEAAFCELSTALDHPDRAPMWAELGALQAGLNRSREAGLCWSRALWERGPEPGPSAAGLAERWTDCEARMLGYPSAAEMLGIVDVVETDLDEQMVRALATAVIAAELGALDEVEFEAEQLAAIQRFLGRHGQLLDLRTLWLARSALARLAGNDRLAMFQTRDAILRALREGVGLARNIPTFVRSHGSDGDAGDLGRLADELTRVRDEYLATPRKRSTIESTHPEVLTHAYVRLVFSWGLARLGRPRHAREELEAARSALGSRVAAPDVAGSDAVHRASFLAFEARIQQALDGLPPGAPFSTDAGGPIAARERLGSMERFKYDRLVELSRVLDPRRDVDAFRRWSRKDEAPFEGLALLGQPSRLAALFDRMLEALAGYGAERRASELRLILEYLEALPDPLAVPRLQTVIGHIPGLDVADQPRLLRGALMLASYYDRTDLSAAVLAAIEGQEARYASERPAEYAELLAQAAPALRRAGFESIQNALLETLDANTGTERDLETVTARLHIAAAHAALGRPDRVQTAVAEAQLLLPELAAVPSDYQRLLREIAGALSRSTPGQAIAGARALMERLPDTTDSLSTNSHYCLAVVQLMEAVVLSLASEDLALSEWARRWVEEDEHLLHRRIHRDLAG